MKPNDRERIVKALAEIEAKQDCRILFAVESGSRASFLEWLGSPIVYRDDGMIASLNEMKADWFNPVHVAYHYASMFRKAMEARNPDGSLRIKKLCYALRAGLCLRYTIAFEKMPPTPFAAVLEGVELSPDEREAVRDVLAKKETAHESDILLPDAKIDGLLEDRYDTIASHSWRARVSTEAVIDQLDALFRSCVKSGGGQTQNP